MAAVALLAEGVDRNPHVCCIFSEQGVVALLAEGVDRNLNLPLAEAIPLRSPSSRRAWIEICSALRVVDAADVALLAEGVDRNMYCRQTSRRAPVALLAEGVDRNCTVVVVRGKVCLSPSSRRAWIEIVRSSAGVKFPLGRPPRGGRG